MPHERLNQILKDLRDELGATEALTDEDRSHLSAVVDQIRSVLDESDEGNGDGSALAVIDDAALHFESEHPRLTKTLYQISELLRSAGLT